MLSAGESKGRKWTLTKRRSETLSTKERADESVGDKCNKILEREKNEGN